MITTKVTVPFLQDDVELRHRWTAERAAEWQEQHRWIIGCNYIPSNAINQLEMWQAHTFSPELIN